MGSAICGVKESDPHFYPQFAWKADEEPPKYALTMRVQSDNTGRNRIMYLRCITLRENQSPLPTLAGCKLDFDDDYYQFSIDCYNDHDQSLNHFEHAKSKLSIMCGFEPEESLDSPHQQYPNVQAAWSGEVLKVFSESDEQCVYLYIDEKLTYYSCKKLHEICMNG